MLNKYVGETSTLFPSDIPGGQKDGYTYEWRYRHQVFSTSYAAKFTFSKHGLHEFELTVTDKTTRMKSTQYYYVEATLRNKPYMGNKFQGDSLTMTDEPIIVMLAPPSPSTSPSPSPSPSPSLSPEEPNQ